jgi:hypothetical protein
VSGSAAFLAVFSFFRRCLAASSSSGWRGFPGAFSESPWAAASRCVRLLCFICLPSLLARPHPPESRHVLTRRPCTSPFPSAESPISSGNGKLLSGQSRGVLPCVLQLGPSQRLPQGGCWPTFATHSPGGRFSPSPRPSAWTFPLGGVGGVVMLPFP